jgi:hypothetical protein
MRQDVNHREVFARQESLGEDFALIFEAIVDAFRLSADSPASRGASIHYASWR